MSARSRAAWIATGSVLAAAAGAIAADRLLAARARRRPPSERAALDLPELDDDVLFPSHDGGSIHAIARGRGQPFVLSHGVSLSVRVWTLQMRRLPPAGFRAIAFDHRGHGESVLGTSGHSLDNLAADVRDVLVRFDVRGGVLVGHSMGGVAAMAFVLTYPEIAAERLAGLVLLSTIARSVIPFGGPRAERAIRFLTARAPDVAPLLAREGLGYLVSRVGFGRAPQPSHVDLTREMILRTASETRRHAATVLVGFDFTHRLHEITVPTLVIGGTGDVLTPSGEARRIAAAIPGARLALLPGAGHMIMLEQPDELDALLADFARRAASARSTGTA